MLRGVQRARAGGGGGGRGRGRAVGACGKGVRQGRVAKERGWDLLRGRPGVRWRRVASRCGEVVQWWQPGGRGAYVMRAAGGERWGRAVEA